jgi:hypothetical protein
MLWQFRTSLEVWPQQALVLLMRRCEQVLKPIKKTQLLGQLNSKENHRHFNSAVGDGLHAVLRIYKVSFSNSSGNCFLYTGKLHCVSTCQTPLSIRADWLGSKFVFWRCSVRMSGRHRLSCGSSWFSSTHPSKCWSITLVRSRSFRSKFVPVHHWSVSSYPTIRRHVVL